MMIALPLLLVLHYWIFPVDCHTVNIGWLGAISKAEYINEKGRLARTTALDYLSGGAFQHALDVFKERTKLENLTIKYELFDYHGHKDWKVNQSVEALVIEGDSIDVLIGPAHTCKTEARLASVYNKLMIAHDCLDPEVADKKLYRTFARTSIHMPSIARSGASLLKAFNWTRHITLLYRTDKQEITQTVILFKEYAKKFGINITQEVRVLLDSGIRPELNISDDTNVMKIWPEYLDRVSKYSRIFVLISRTETPLGLAYVMEKRGMFANGEYQLVVIDVNSMSFIHRLDSPLEHGGRYDFMNDRLTGQDFMRKVQRNILLVARTPVEQEFSFNRILVEKLGGWVPEKTWAQQNRTLSQNTLMPTRAYNLYDAVLLYLGVVERIINDGGNRSNYSDGLTAFSYLINTSYIDAANLGRRIDVYGNSEGNFTLYGWQKGYDRNRRVEALNLFPAGLFINVKADDVQKMNLIGYINWTGPPGSGPPLDVPLCGFENEFCIVPEPIELYISVGVLGGLLLIAMIVAVYVYRSWKYEQELDKMMWRVQWDDIKIVTKEGRHSTTGPMFGSMMLSKASMAKSAVSVGSNPDIQQTFTKVAVYKANTVAVKMINKKAIEMDRNQKKELKTARDIRSDNLAQFIGACIDPPNICLLYEYCPKGSLQDVLENDDVSLDNMFRASMVNDILKGLTALFNSALLLHGNLKSSNCLIDGRWVLKLTDFGLRQFKEDRKSEELMKTQSTHAYYTSMFWTAPEHIREENRTYTQKGDIYSFAIILFEIHGRCGPYDELELDPEQIIRKLKVVQPGEQLTRPRLAYIDTTPKYITDLIKDCWAENPESRPDIKTIQQRLKPMQKGLKPNIMDNMIAIMEKYANNLEGIIAERTEQLIEEKKKTDELLNQMLPRSVAEQLKQGKQVEAETFESVSIYFSDICGFTALSAESTPIQVVDLLNDLYTCFDSIIGNFDVYKVETIGDAYMVVSGLPIRNGNRHAGEIAQMSLKLLEAIQVFRVRHRPGYTLQLRIGIHSGSVVAGVVGLKMPRYCLFGDTVNTASRMESNGLPLKIHCSPECQEVLANLGGYDLEERGMVAMKGKGEILTYWVNGYTPQD